jgi:pyruvate formate lyase activating enzyme
VRPRAGGGTPFLMLAASDGGEIPWHATAFHKDDRMIDPDDTSSEMLLRARAIGARAGLRFIYAGNLQQRIGVSGRCPRCGSSIPGVWC